MNPENDDNDDYINHNNNALLVKYSGTPSHEQEKSSRQQRPELLEFTENYSASA